ncbi:MAG: M20 family metallopeptidase, partial [Chloroflexota bacterium]
MDTVGIEGMSLDDPLSGEIRDGRLWGRGSSDMKGGLAAAVTALQALHDVRHQLHGRVIFASVVEEECNGSGAGALTWIDRLSKRQGRALQVAEFALCTDGSGPEVWRGYGGVLTVDVHVEGRTGHPARPGGVSAIEQALVVKGAIDRYKAEREALGEGRNVNLGVFRGGAHPSVVAGSAVMSLNMSYPFADASAAEASGQGFGNTPGRHRFEALIQERCASDPWLQEHPPRIDWIKDLISFELAESHPLVQGLAEAHRKVLGQEPSIQINPAWSDACYLPRFAGTPGQAHGPAEYAETWRIVDCAGVLAAFLYDRLRA